MTKKRIHLRRGKQKRNFILCRGVIPRVGDTCTLNGQDWEVAKIESTKVIAVFRTEAGRLKQVFPCQE